MDWMGPTVAAFFGLLAGVLVGRYMEWNEMRWKLRKRLIRRRTRRMINQWKNRKPPTPQIRFGRRVINGLEPPPPDHRPHPH